MEKKNKSIMNQKKYREVLARVLSENIKTFDATDLFYEFTETKEVTTKINKLKGDVDTNPRIKKFEDEGIALIEQSIRNISNYIKQQLPLWIITDKLNITKE